ncbi:MAG: preprotein translocase subunit SecA [Rickettsiaceae bacterium]|nr:preprotein translocase subunit SecA [Rickettsiaceae bacterium]
MFGFFRKFFGTANDRLVKKLMSEVVLINNLEPQMKKLSNDEFKLQTQILKNRLASKETLHDISYEAFALVREASVRVFGMRHFDVQCAGGLILHRGGISEMRTGEGKTLVSTLPAYLNALEGKGVHIVTPNDYLALRDSSMMGRLYSFLGLTTGCITSGISDSARKEQYNADITYATNNELGFDYLRDNMKFTLESRSQREFNYAIIDEVDSILIDEARTPLIISGAVDDNTELYVVIDSLMRKINKDFVEKDEKMRTVNLTEEGINIIEAALAKANLIKPGSGLYDFENIRLVHFINQALKAHYLFTKDVDYLVQNKKVVIIDEFTGRISEGRRYSEGLHQALEAKEKVPIQNENQTLASITFQNYFRQYKKLSGMTGTAMTEANELKDIYNLDVVGVPTHHPSQRIDCDDEIYGTKEEKNEAIIKTIQECYQIGQPVLVGTVSVEKSEEISKLLKKINIPHNILNAKNHEKEAYIIAQAGRYKAVTIATNMAGRGTDIQLGGNVEMLLEEIISTAKDNTEIERLKHEIQQQVSTEKQKVVALGGLYVIGTERHESRRIDNQLRGRSARQGDPGKTKFFLSLEDDLMRLFASPKMTMILKTLGLSNGEAIFHPMISRSLEKAQQKVEAHNYEIRKNLLKFDDVMNDQRHIIYQQRNDIINASQLIESSIEFAENILAKIFNDCIPTDSLKEKWDIDRLDSEIHRIFNVECKAKEYLTKDMNDAEILKEISDILVGFLRKKENNYGAELFNSALKHIFISNLDMCWKDHLHSLDHLRQGISLRAYGQKDPLVEYKREAFELFNSMLDTYAEQVVTASYQFYLESMQEIDLASKELASKTKNLKEVREDPAFANYNSGGASIEARPQPYVSRVQDEDRDPLDPSTWGRISRNELCPCKSGKKYKFCHGSL